MFGRKEKKKKKILNQLKLEEMKEIILKKEKDLKLMVL